MRVTLLGTGTSTGVPMIGCGCEVCLSKDPHDKRLRVSAMIESGDTRLIIDTSADFRQQMLAHHVKQISAILYTHHHYDHIAGFDDLRAFLFLYRKAPKCFALQSTYDFIRRTFAYAFGDAIQSGGGLPEADFEIVRDTKFTVEGLDVTPIPLMHGLLPILGYRVGSFAYLTDCNAIPDASLALLQGLDVVVLDGLRYQPHSTHLSIHEAIEYAHRIGAKQTYLTHMNHDVLHSRASKELPAGIALGFDGLSFEILD